MNAVVCCLALLLLAGGEPQDRRGMKRGKGVPEGKEAPDFNLKKLLASDAERTGEAEFVKLSDFKNKQPVVLIFGSYT